MQFPNLEDDDGDFGVNSVASRSRLSSLFQTEKASGDVNQALTFTAPKQPKKNDNTQSSQGTLELIHATAVHAYKLIDGNYTNQGKLGCAILGLHEISSYKLLLYKGKQVQVTASTITPSFKFHVQPNNYATFYDEKNENWSINFESETALLNFSKQLALTKANSQDKNQPTLMVQDITQGDGTSLEMGDSAEVKYTGWLVTNYKFGQVFDSNVQSESAFRLRLGKKVIKGWSEGLVGAQKGTRRLLIVPPNLAYGAEGMGNAVPPNSTLIFEIFVTKIKKSRDSSHSPSPLKAVDTVPEKKPEVLPRHSISSEDNIRLRGASISEQLSQSPKKDKAQLISRMAKMGTATLPFQGAIAAQVSSDSENEEETVREKASPPVHLSGSRTSSPKPASRSMSRKNSEQMSAPQVQLQSVQETNSYPMNQQSNSVPQFFPQAMLPSQQPFPSPNVYPSFQQPISNQYPVPQAPYSVHTMPGYINPVTSSIADTHLPMLITETRSQNTEVRLSLSKITEKVENVIQKIDDLRLNQGRAGTLSHSSFMDSALLVQSIEKIVQENNQLKEDVETKNSKIQSLNEKIYDLLQRNQRFFEESNNILEQKSDSIQAASMETQTKLLNLEKEKAKLSSELSDALQKLRILENELANHQNLKSELSQKLQEGEKQLEELNSELSNFKKQIDSESVDIAVINNLRTEVKELSGERNVLETQVKDWKEKYHSTDLVLQEKTKKLQVLQKQLDQNISESKNSSLVENNEKINALGQEIETIQTERKELVAKCQELEAKVAESLKSESLLKERVKLLEAQLQNALPWKAKYENFYRKTLQMKENYENEMQKLITELKQAQSSYVATGSSDFSGEIKRVMNVLYKMLQGKFESTSSYSGTQVLETTLQTIRVLIIQMLQRKGDRSDTITKETESVKTVETEVPKQAETHPPAGKVSLKDWENSDRPVAEVLENGIQNEVPEEKEISSEIVDQSLVNLENSSEETIHHKVSLSSDTKLAEETVSEDNTMNVNSKDQLLQNESDLQTENLDLKEKSEETKVSNEDSEKSKLTSHPRVSPDHAEQLFSTNGSGASFSDTAKVLDGFPDMHA